MWKIWKNGCVIFSFIDQHFDTMFERSGKGLTWLWLQDGDPSQNSKSARDAMARCHSEVLKIPPRSPDLNPIETFSTLYLGSWKKTQLIRELHVSHIKSSVIECGEQSIVSLTSWSIKL